LLLNFAVEFNLRRYDTLTTADGRIAELEKAMEGAATEVQNLTAHSKATAAAAAAEAVVREVRAYTPPLFSSTSAVSVIETLNPPSASP